MVSIIILTYKSDQYLFDCLKSIFLQKIQIPYEIIVVDNDEKSSLEKKLQKEYPQIVYIKSKENGGYSSGNNKGAMQAKGEFLFFLNPDTRLENTVVDTLAKFLKQNPKAGMVAPLHLDDKKNVYPLQGAQELTPKRAIFSLSFIQKLIPNNHIANQYWNKDWDKKDIREVDIVPGSAFMIRNVLFKKLGGFDENYFLFFEEHDLGNRVKKVGYKNYMIPQAQLIHSWGKSTEKSDKNIQKIFQESRFYYFKKFYGLSTALFTEAIVRFSKETLFVIGILLVAAFLLLYQLQTRMIFIGDVAWFYISARDMLVQGNIPLVGIASSHPWIHQGAFWTYIVAVALWVGRFNPLAGGYAAAVIGVITVFTLYYCVKRVFGTTPALFSMAFYATSPLVVINARMPYHTAPIPLFVILYFYALTSWLKGKPYFFPLGIFFLAVLYNFELATVVLAIPLVLLFIYGIYVKALWIETLKNKKVLFFSFLAFCVPLLPMMIYDTTHGYGQTLKFVAWIGYRILVVFGYPPLHPEIPAGTFINTISFFERVVQLFYYLPNIIIALLLAVGSMGWLGWEMVKKRNKNMLLLGITLFIPASIIFFNKVASEAYLPILFIQLAITVGLCFTFLKNVLKKSSWTVYVLFLVIMMSNVVSLITYDFFAPLNATWVKKRDVSKQIIQKAKGNPYTIVGRGEGSQFRSFTMPYEYLTWWLGTPSREGANTKVIVHEYETDISTSKK
jgi:GT2 family glycosyltransferase